MRIPIHRTLPILYNFSSELSFVTILKYYISQTLGADVFFRKTPKFKSVSKERKQEEDQLEPLASSPFGHY